MDAAIVYAPGVITLPARSESRSLLRGVTSTPEEMKTSARSSSADRHRLQIADFDETDPGLTVVRPRAAPKPTGYTEFIREPAEKSTGRNG